MSMSSRLRLMVVSVAVFSLLAVLLGKLWQVQVLAGDDYEQAANDARTREVIRPAPRGEIYDSGGRPLAANHSKLTVTVSRPDLLRLPDNGKASLHRLATALPDHSYERIRSRIRLCSEGADQPCWNGTRYQPIPVADDVSPRTAVEIMERRSFYPAVHVGQSSVRRYPSPAGADAAHTLGHVGPINERQYEQRKDDRPRLAPGTRVGQDGLEAQYERYLRGKPGGRSLEVDSSGHVTRTRHSTPPVSGSNLVTSINADVQAAAEKAVRQANADNGAAAVVMDVRTGRVIALASQPTFDPNVWVGGLSQQSYQRLNSGEADNPMVSRPTQGEYPVGSTFKVVSTAAAVKAGYPLRGTYSCPSDYSVGNRTFQNYGGAGYGQIDLHRALVVSCDTVFYRFAHQLWKRDGGNDPVQNPKEPIATMAKKFGFDRKTGIDLPSESEGRVPDRAWKRNYWNGTKDYYCEHAETGYPEVAKDDPGRAAYLQQLARDNCQRGHKWRPGDAVNLAIGQGDMSATPLQLTRAYAAIAGGGELYEPRIGKAIVRPDGTVPKNIDPPKTGELPLRPEVIRYIKNALADVPRNGTAAGAFSGFPLDRIPVAGKTGTAETYGEEDTAWFASFAPVDEPRFAVVGMVSQGGLGAEAAAPIVRDVYESIYGVGDQQPAFPEGAPPDRLPRVNDAGQVQPPPGYRTGRAATAAGASPAPPPEWDIAPSRDPRARVPDQVGTGDAYRR